MDKITKIINLAEFQKHHGKKPKPPLDECSEQTPPSTKTATSSTTSTSTTKITPFESPSNIQWFWEKMTGIYGHTWTSTYNDEAMKIWGATFTRRGLTRKELRRGISKCLDRGSQFPPNLPEFIKLCQLSETDLGLPDFETAFREATVERGKFYYQPNGYWQWASQTHPAIYHAVRNITSLSSFDQWPETKTRQIFREAWQKVINRLIAGKELEPMPKVIESQKPQPQTKGEGYAAFKRLVEKQRRGQPKPQPEIKNKGDFKAENGVKSTELGDKMSKAEIGLKSDVRNTKQHESQNREQEEAIKNCPYCDHEGFVHFYFPKMDVTLPKTCDHNAELIQRIALERSATIVSAKEGYRNPNPKP